MEIDREGDVIFVKSMRNGTPHRRVIYAGADFSTEPQEVKTFAVECGFAQIRPVTFQQSYTLADFDAAITTHIDAVARERDFDNAADATTFANSTQAAWSAEALAFIAWRDSIWIAFEAAKSNLPATASAFISGLPAIVWPQS